MPRIPGRALRGSNGSGRSSQPSAPEPEGPSSIEAPPPPAGPEEAAWPDDDDSRLTVSSAVRNNRVAFLLPIVFLVSAAAVAGLLRSPTYTAETRLAVGGLDASSPASNSDFAAAAATLAQTYGRSVQGDVVVDAVARKTHSSPATVRAHIAAFTVPSTPLFSVEGVAGSPGAAIALANLTSEALRKAASEATQDLVPPLLAQYRQAATAQQRVERKVRFLQATEPGSELVEARAQLAIAQTRAVSAREAFVAGQQRQQSLAVPIQVIERASSAGSDRYSVLELWIFIAVVLGLIVGTALALFRESRFLRYAT
jgi:uncharacterized protein involved in exopolysaccharide biosynthesis